MKAAKMQGVGRRNGVSGDIDQERRKRTGLEKENPRVVSDRPTRFPCVFLFLQVGDRPRMIKEDRREERKARTFVVGREVVMVCKV